MIHTRNPAPGIPPQPSTNAVWQLCRVSTDNEEQQTSYEAQVDYSYIRSNPEWQFVEFTDEGISATNTKSETASTA